jgi:hypothetical protein
MEHGCPVEVNGAASAVSHFEIELFQAAMHGLPVKLFVMSGFEPGKRLQSLLKLPKQVEGEPGLFESVGWWYSCASGFILTAPANQPGKTGCIPSGNYFETPDLSPRQPLLCSVKHYNNCCNSTDRQVEPF